MDLELFKQKVQDRSLTVGEAFDYVAARKDTEKPDTIRGLKNNVAVDLDSKFFDTYNTKEFSDALEEPVNRWREYSVFEGQLSKGLRSAKVADVNYEKLSGKGGLAQEAFGLKGVQDRPKDPMRGTIYSRDFDRVYNKALSDPLIDQEAKDYLIYEKYTGQRVETNIGKEGLKITDLAVSTDPNGNVVVNIAEKKSKTKTRPAVKYTGAFAQFLAGKKAQALQREAGSDPSTKNLFATTKGATEKVWNAHVKPALEAEFSDSLPSDGKGGGKATPKVLRKILARQLVDEFKYPRDLVKGWMGHAGATVTAQGDLLEQSYVGVITDPRVGEISDNLIKTEALNLGNSTVNDMFVARSPNTSKGFTEGKAYNPHSSPYTFGKEDVKQSATELTDIQKQTLTATQQTQLNEAQIKLYESETARDEARKKRIIASQDTMVEDIKKKEAERKVRAELKEKSKLLNAPASPDDLSDGLKSKLAKFGIMLGKKIPIVAAGLAYKEAEAKGMSPVESILYGASELTPVPASDVEAAGAFVKQARREGIPQALGLDVERQEQMNKLRQERMDARSRRNMPNLDDIPDTEDPDTLPPEALRVMQQDADMTNTDLDPEAGFISEADVMKNQQMGSPTSQGFMSKYGEEDQNLLQTT